MNRLRERLDACAQKAAFSTSDLSLWLDTAYATVKSWRAGTEPYEARRNQIEQRLLWLEDAVEKSPLLPVPLVIRAAERKAYILDVRRSYEQR